MIVLELFPCSGGLSEGLRRAGIPATIAFDYSADACDSHEKNQGLRPIQIDARDLLRMAESGWSPGPIDLFVADPPCTPWSHAGKRLGQDDERDMLAVTVELVRLLRPRAYLIANVPGLDDGPNLPIVQRTIGSLGREGYCVADFGRLDAADYGVPQHRVRPFWFGHLAGPCLVWPSRTHGSPEECARPTLPGVDQLRPWVTCREALGHLDADELGKRISLRWKSSAHPPSRVDEPAHVVPSSQPGNGGAVLVSEDMFAPSSADAPSRTIRAAARGQQLVTGIDHRPSDLDEPAKTLTTNTHSDGALLVLPRHPVSPDADGLSRTIRASDGGTPDKILVWPWDRPSTVVAAGPVLAPHGRNGRDGEHQRAHPNVVKLSERAASILQGFPDGWHFAGATKAARWAQIGMAMPPPLGEVVARAVADQLAATKTKRKRRRAA